MTTAAFMAALDSDLAKGLDDLIRQTPIFLDHQQRLWPASACVRADNAEVPGALADSGLHFWSGDPQTYRMAASLIAPFSLTHLWDALRPQLRQDAPLSEAPAWLNTTAKLKKLYRTIIATHESINKGDVDTIAICVSRNATLCRPGKLFLPYGEPKLYALLADDPGAALGAEEMHEDRTLRALYEDMGVPQFGVAQLCERLEKLARAECHLNEAHACLNTREKLLSLYRYLSGKRSDLQREHVEALRHRLPIWLCRDEMLHYAKDRALPPENTDLPAYISINHVLDIESKDNLRSFLAETLGLQPLSIAQFITQEFLPQFAALERKQQVEALRFIRGCIETIRVDTTLRDALKDAPLIYDDDDQLHCATDLCFPGAPCRAIFPNRFNEPHHTRYLPPKPGTTDNWMWRDLFGLLGLNYHAPVSVVVQEIKQLTRLTPRQGREQIETIFRYIEKHWDEFYYQRGIGARLKDERWLPADGDDTHWYRASELYHSHDKPLVGHVAKVLGFNEARRPQKGIADALGFPASVPVEKMVQQLLRLSERGEAATSHLYRRLNESATDEQLKPLRGQAIIYANERYWKPEHIFLSNQRASFGRYSGYAPNSEYNKLLHNLGARETPAPKDYVELLCEISAQQRENIPLEVAQLIYNAYDQLAAAPDPIIAPLRAIPCVLLAEGAIEGANPQQFALCRSDSAVLEPSERFRKRFPNLPVASYHPAGEATLRRLGVRRIEDITKIDYRLQPQTTDRIELLRYFGRLERSIRRLLFHEERNIEQEVPVILKRRNALEGYWQLAVHVAYHATIGQQAYSSEATSEDGFYDKQRGHVYLRRGLNPEGVICELAGVLDDILALRDSRHALLSALIRDPARAEEHLDRNNIKPLPRELDLAVAETLIDEFRIGADSPDMAAEDALPAASAQTAAVDSPRPSAVEARNIPTAASAQNGKPVQQRLGELFDDQQPHTTPTSGAAQTPAPHGDAQRRNGATNGNHANAPEKRHENNKKERSDTLDSLPRQARKPASPPPQRDPAAPRFEGTTVIASPNIATDYDGLRERASAWAEAKNLPLTGSAATPPPWQPRPPRAPQKPQPVEERDHGRFVLSFLEVERGFLRLNGQAKSLFPGLPGSVTCKTNEGPSFPLWLDWQRDKPIAYNQEALRNFFADNGIPAGGIVYLQREHGTTFRLYFNHCPHTVREVRIAFNEQGQVQYEVHDAEVECETDDAIYRAERRFEDRAALWLEAVGKKSVEETLCDLLMAAPDGWSHEDDLKSMLCAERMVAASTVEQTLRKKPFFVSGDQDYWRLDPALLLAHSRDNAVAQWHKATTKLLGCDDAMLYEASAALRPPLQEPNSRLLQLDRQATPLHEQNYDSADLIQQLNDDPTSHMLSASLVNIIQQRLDADDVDPASDTTLRALFGTASEEVWLLVLRPALKTSLEQLQRTHKYQRAHGLAQSWSGYDLTHGPDLVTIAAEARAWALIDQGEPTLEAVLQAIDSISNALRGCARAGPRWRWRWKAGPTKGCG